MNVQDGIESKGDANAEEQHSLGSEVADDVGHEFHHRIYALDRLRPKALSPDAYVWGDVTCHLHIQLDTWPVRGLRPKQFCIEFYCPSLYQSGPLVNVGKHDHIHLRDGVIGEPVDGENGNHDFREQPMFVRVGPVAEVREQSPL